MIAEVGGIRNVSGSRMATPFAPPRPGSTPMMVPSVMPTTDIRRLNGVIATWKPLRMFSKPISVPEPGFDGSLRERDEEPTLEDHEGDHRNADGEREGGDPGVLPDPAHVEAQIQRRRHVEAEELRDQHHRRGGNGHREHGAQLLRSDERLVRVPPDRPHHHGHAVRDQDHREPEGEEPALRPVRSPAKAEPDGRDEDEHAEPGEQDGDDDVGFAHPITWGAVRPWPSDPCGASRPPPPTWRIRRRWRRPD